jgi:hypothetical protein
MTLEASNDEHPGDPQALWHAAGCKNHTPKEWVEGIYHVYGYLAALSHGTVLSLITLMKRISLRETRDVEASRYPTQIVIAAISPLSVDYPIFTVALKK